MLTRRRFLVLLGGTVPVAAGIGAGIWLLPGDEASANEPTIRWNEENCAHCGMTISDRQYAAGWIEPGNRQQRFDDVGCMVVSFREHTPPSGTRLFARDFAGDRWLDAKTAVYAVSGDIRSPMAYGVAAFETAAAAEGALGDAAKQTRTFDDLVEELERRG
jgi:copper chaperone NosL